MVYYLITCRSLTYAQRAARALERSGITAIVARPPTGFVESGCAYSLKVSEKHFQNALMILNSEGLKYKKVFLLKDDGTGTEIDPGEVEL